MAMIVVVEAAEADSVIDSLADLLVDAVDSGASVGFMPPLAHSDALGYWREVFQAVAEGSRVLLAARDETGIVGSMQIGLEMRANGNHRAELMKLFVQRRARRRGIATLLMDAAEAEAARRGRTLLLMDTRAGGEADRMCEARGYVRWGQVPRYARSSDGRLHTTNFYSKELQG